MLAGKALLLAIALGVPTGEAPPPDTTLDPQPVDGFTPLCHGPWKRAEESAPYRGVSAEDNGSGRCCPLAGSSFLCVIHPGHQHGPVVEEHVRFYDGAATKARVDLVTTAYANPGMNPDFDAPPPPPFAELEMVVTTKGFLLRPTDVRACTRPVPEARDVCRNVGTSVWQRGIPVRR